MPKERDRAEDRAELPSLAPEPSLDMPIIDMSVDDDRWVTHQGLIQDMLEKVCSLIGLRHGELSVVLTHDTRIASLNTQYREKNNPTNVLSFPCLSLNAPVEISTLPQTAFLLGDIILAFETITREAQEQGKLFSDHLAHLLVHGLLHLLGYDHVDDQQADVMESFESEILGRLGYDDPYSAKEV